MTGAASAAAVEYNAAEVPAATEAAIAAAAVAGALQTRMRGTLLVQEAGGAVSDLAGKEYALTTVDVLACASGIHGEMIDAFERCDSTGRDNAVHQAVG